MTVSAAAAKAAILLRSLGPEAAEEVLTRIGPEYSGRLRTEMQRLDQAPASQELLDEVLREFDQLLQTADGNPGMMPALAAGTEPTDDASAPEATAPAPLRLVSPPPPEPQPAAEEPKRRVPAAVGDAVAALRWLEPHLLATALQGEHPHTVSLVLNCLEAEPAGEVLKRLPPEMRRDVSLRLSHGVSGAAPVLQRIAQALLQKCRTLEQSPSEPSDDARFRKMADMLRLLEKADRIEILTALEQNDADRAAKVKEYLYQFEDLLLIEDRSMQKLLSEIDSKSLATALKGAAGEIQEKVRNNLSKRARETLSEEMEFMGSIPSAQIQQAQKAVVEVIQRLDQAGELVIKE